MTPPPFPPPCPPGHVPLSVPPAVCAPQYPSLCSPALHPPAVTPPPCPPLCPPSHVPLSMPPAVSSPGAPHHAPQPCIPQTNLSRLPPGRASHFTTAPLAMPISARAPKHCLSLSPVLTTIDWQDLAACAPILPTTAASPVTLQQVTPQLGQAWLPPAQGTHKNGPLKPMGGWQPPPASGFPPVKWAHWGTASCHTCWMG